MATTPSGLQYGALTDAPNGPGLAQALAASIEAIMQKSVANIAALRTRVSTSTSRTLTRLFGMTTRRGRGGGSTTRQTRAPTPSSPNLISMSVTSGSVTTTGFTANMYRTTGSGSVSFNWIAVMP